MADDVEVPLDLSLSSAEKKARHQYLQYLASRPNCRGCWDCLMIFPDEMLFNIHQFAHSMTNRLTCKCGITFPSRTQFHEHIIAQAHPVIL